MKIIWLALLFVLGACFGSFLCCQARRLHLKETKKRTLGSRSVCMSCQTKLSWHDNIPIISWLLLRGKCRKCGKKIGVAEILSELGMALAFLMLGTTINLATVSLQEWLIFVVTAVFTLIIGFLAIYDGLYGELPSFFLMLAVVCGLIVATLKVWMLVSLEFSWGTFFTSLSIPFISVLIFGGLYLLLYLASKGKWVGDGDWLLATAIALVLFHPWYTLIALFLANFLAFIVMLPQLKKTKNHKIYFGPFLAISFIITLTFTEFLISML